MLFTKKIEEITFNDVVVFCNQQIRESINLDYKKDFPKDLEKTISAFANTVGGLIIIGVEEEDSKPKSPFEGLEYKDSLSEQVTNIIISNIYPPFFPEVHVCDKVNNKTFIIIRVPQSNMTPHYIKHRKYVYVRTNDISKPEDLATAERIEWIRERRNKAIEFKKLLICNAQERCNNYMATYKLSEVSKIEATISAIPLYPDSPYGNYQEIKEIVKDIPSIGYGGYSSFSNNPAGMRSVQGGLSYFNDSVDDIAYTELNQFGMLFCNKVGISGTLTDQEKNSQIIFLHIIIIIDLFLDSASKFYKALGYYGIIELNFSLKGLLGSQIFLSGDNLSPHCNSLIDNELSWKREFYVNDIMQSERAVLVKLIKDVCWDLGGVNITENIIRDILKANNRL